MSKEEKRVLWETRIQQFRSSGQTCKVWCQEQQISVATMNYWLRKQKANETFSEQETLFAKLPTEEFVLKNSSVAPLPIRIFITENIKIEISSCCSTELLQTLVRTLKEYA
mgnify:CR=1 FL=1